MNGGDSFGRRRIALITGITGQDGSYLAEYLIEKCYTVHGMIRRASTFNTSRIQHLYEDRCSHRSEGSFFLHYGDMTDSSRLASLLSTIRPDEVYNLAAQSHVKVSFDLAEYTTDVDALGVLRLLDAIRTCGLQDSIRFYQASSSELYGKVMETPQNENTQFYPQSPYGCAKLYAYWICKVYREAYKMFICNGILFNHESPRRGDSFVTRKISRSVAKVHLGLIESFELGNLDAKRDWGHAKDYVRAMWQMMQLKKADDLVICTGEVHSVREFVERAFAITGRCIIWRGSGDQEVGVEQCTDIARVFVNPKYYRPAEVEFLQGDSSKAKQLFHWQPEYTFDRLVTEMVNSDIELFKKNPTA